MRHGKKLNHLGRTAPHRKALMANMASSLIIHKKITTTVAKAKALRMYVEPLITKSKENTTHNHRTVFAYLKDKHAVNELFTVVGDKVASRPGGYTRILKLGNRAGDNADMAMIELVDFNELFSGFGADKKANSKRTRRGRSGSNAPKTAEVKTETAAVVEEIAAPVVEEVATVETVEAVETEVQPAAEAEVVAEEVPATEEATSESADESETSSEESPEEK